MVFIFRGRKFHTVLAMKAKISLTSDQTSTNNPPLHIAFYGIQIFCPTFPTPLYTPPIKACHVLT